MPAPCYATVEDLRIGGLYTGMKYSLLSNLADPEKGMQWMATGIFEGRHPPQATSTRGYIRAVKLNAKTQNEKRGIIYIVELQEEPLASPPPCPTAMGGAKRKSKTHKKKRANKKRTTRKH
jgi:hypothetical protein